MCFFSFFTPLIPIFAVSRETAYQTYCFHFPERKVRFAVYFIALILKSYISAYTDIKDFPYVDRYIVAGILVFRIGCLPVFVQAVKFRFRFGRDPSRSRTVCEFGIIGGYGCGNIMRIISETSVV